MKKHIAILLVVVIFSLDFATAQAPKEQKILVRILSKEDCLVANTTVSCSEIGNKLRQLAISPTTVVEFSADGYGGFDTLKIAMASVSHAGYKGRVSFSTGPT